MPNLFNNKALPGSEYRYTIENSLRFNASQSSYLNWTSPPVGNRKTWTYSFWVKRGSLSSYQFITSALQSAAADDNIGFMADDTFRFRVYDGGATIYGLTTTQVFRDPSAWYHFVCLYDSTQATSSDRMKLYVNGTQVTSFGTATYPSLNFQSTGINNTYTQNIGRYANGTYYFDGYLSEINFIDGQALDSSYFGDYNPTTGVWQPRPYDGTYGTNGFYLPMRADKVSEGFNTVTWRGNGTTNTKIAGVGFSPDLVWIKNRTSAIDNVLENTVSGAGVYLVSNTTAAEASYATGLLSFDTDGFSVGSGTGVNGSGSSYVAWCWDAGGTTVSNSDGSITSSVRANQTYGFSIVKWTGTDTDASTVGHGLGVAPNLLITKGLTNTTSWVVGIGNISGFSVNDYLSLNSTNEKLSTTTFYQAYGSSTFTVGVSAANEMNRTSNDYVTYCFAEKPGYSKFGSYTGTGTAGNSVRTGFRPAFVMIKRTDSAGSWLLRDSTRNATGVCDLSLIADGADFEGVSPANSITMTDTGFELSGGGVASNTSDGTYIYMAFADTRDFGFWWDKSGNENNWQPNGGITSQSAVFDVPTLTSDTSANYAVINPLAKDGGTTLSDANLKISSVNYGNNTATMFLTSGKWYWEAQGDGYVGAVCGQEGQNWSTSLSATGSKSIGYYINGTVYWDGGNNGGGLSTYGTSDVIGVAVDMDAGTVAFYKNGSLEYTATFGSGTVPDLSAGVFPCYNNGASSSTAKVVTFNFGQRPFAYTPPTGFKALNTYNLPDSTIKDGSKHMNIAVYSGTSAEQSITGLGFQPDMTWIKNRTTNASHGLADVLRGAKQRLYPDLDYAESSYAAGEGFVSFDSDGFTVDVGLAVGTSANDYVAWNWKAGGAGVTNTDGDTTSTVSANPTAGFSIVTFTSLTGTNSVGHGLGVKPKIVIQKRTDSTSNWYVYYDFVDGSLDYMRLDTTGGAAAWSGTAATSSVFYENWAAGYDIVSYCFAEVDGYSKMGSYTGNNAADGPFVYTGFRPAFVIIKSTGATAEQWWIHNSATGTYNPIGPWLYASENNQEQSAERIDFLSNGFKIRGAFTSHNGSAITYIYIAFAENPFKNSLAR